MGRRPRTDAGQPDHMILIDTSAWVEFLRDTGSVVCNRVDSILDNEIATCHPVRMEVLAGAVTNATCTTFDACSLERLSYRPSRRTTRTPPPCTAAAAARARR